MGHGTPHSIFQQIDWQDFRVHRAVLLSTNQLVETETPGESKREICQTKGTDSWWTQETEELGLDRSHQLASSETQQP